MKKYFLIFIVISSVGLYRVNAQQVPIFTQYMFNNYIINPAIAGTHSYYQIRSNHRFQWIGITDPPLTNTLSIYGPHSSLPMGFGGFLFSDVTGPTSRTGINGSYAYNISLNEDIRLSMGLSLGFIQFKIDGTRISLPDPSDIAMLGTVYSSLVPDASFGLYLYATNFYAGFSATQLLGNNLKIYDVKSGLNKLKSHFYLTGGYKYFINPDFALEPSVIIKKTSPVPLQIDLSAKVTYQNIVWLGLSIRSNDAMSILLGYLYQDKFYIGYSYDFGISDIRKYNSGSHEIMIGYKFNPIPGK